MNAIVVLSTAGSIKLAEKIAKSLVKSCEAACVNIIPSMRSVYTWEGKVCNDKEVFMIIKSTAENFEAIRSKVRKLHTYKVPEVIALPIVAGDQDYLDWLHSIS